MNNMINKWDEDGNIYHDYAYFDLIRTVLHGTEKSDRTGTGTISAPFLQQRFSLKNGSIPLLTSKKMFVRGIIHELLWYIAGDRNIKYLNDHGVHIWDQWADPDGDLGPVYGAQWRNWTGLRDDGSVDHIDQIYEVIRKLRTNPTDRGIILSSWNVAQLPDMNLRPCHCLMQFWSDGEHLHAHLYQRSCDLGLGVPFNIVQYSIFTHMVAQVVGLKPIEFVWTGGDVHIYNNHREKLIEQLVRDPYPSPQISLNRSIEVLGEFSYDDIQINNYQCHSPIKMEVSV